MTASGGDLRRLGLMLAVLCAGVSGCAHHKAVRTLMLPPFTPVELAQMPVDDDPPMVEGEDDTDDLPPVPVAEGATTPRRQKKRPVKAPAPVTVADAEPAPVAAAAPAAAPTPAESASAIGELRPGGGDLDPKAQKEAEELIGANEKRLGGLSADVLKSQAALVSNVRNFQRQAVQALQTGDAGGAKTLATKGKLLLDELEKTAGS